MRAGLLQHLVTIERKTETVSVSGSVVSAWSPVATVRAQVVTASADEFLTGFGEAEAGNVVFRIRWHEGVATADRIMHAGKAHDIKAVAEIGRRAMLEIKAVATT